MKGLDFFATWFVELENSLLTFDDSDKRCDFQPCCCRCMIHEIYHFVMMKRGQSAALYQRSGRSTGDSPQTMFTREFFFNKMIPMNILCSSGFLTNSFMMKVHKILNLFLFTWVAFFCWCFSENCGKIFSLPVLQKSRFVSPAFYYHNGCTRDSWKFQTGSCNLWNVSETSRHDREMTRVRVIEIHVGRV